MGGVISLFLSGIVKLPLSEYDESSYKRQLYLQGIAKEVYKENARLQGAKFK